MKKILLAIPEYLYKDIEILQPFVTTTITGTILQMIEHGVNYEYKKKARYIKEAREKEKQHQESTSTADQDQENNTRLMEIVQVKWAKGENQ